MPIVEVPADTSPETIRLVSSCMNPIWAQKNPNPAMQAHMECEVGVCVTKTVAYRTLVAQGRLVPDSSRT